MLAERQQQLRMRMQKNREAQEETQKRREELIKELEEERTLRRQEKELRESRRTAWLQEIDAQVGSWHRCWTLAESKSNLLYFLLL